ncbi:MAG: hypothetical protein U0527_12440 [Candidatus Eisenbacteria bacterium]
MMQRALGLLTALPFVVLALASPVVARSTCVNYDEKLHWVKNVDLPAINVKLQGDLAYVLSNDNPRTLHILDLSDSSHPTELGVYPFEIGYRVFAVSGDLLVVGGYTQIQVVDVSNPSAPITRSVIPWGGRSRTWQFSITCAWPWASSRARISTSPVPSERTISRIPTLRSKFSHSRSLNARVE